MAVATVPPALGRIAKSRRPSSGGITSGSTVSMRARGGASATRPRVKASTSGSLPCTSISTPPPSLRTQPTRPRLRA
jgi:hypothetical protein